jgi:hypothetical protein
MLLNIDPKLAEAISKRLDEMNKRSAVPHFERSENMPELRSYLRDRIFQSDKKVNDFIALCEQDALAPK